jgi:hypothetical protein
MDAPIGYAQPRRRDVRAILFEANGEAIDVLIPQQPPARAIVTEAISLAIVTGFGLSLIALTILLARRGRQIVGIAGCACLLIVLLDVIRKSIRRIRLTATFGRSPITLSFGKQTLAIDSPCGVDGPARMFDVRDVLSVGVFTHAMILSAMQVRFRVMLRDGTFHEVRFATADRDAIRRLRGLAENFSAALA